MTRLEQLIAAADALRSLAEDDPAKVPLAAMVDEINAIRALPLEEQTREEPLVKRTRKAKA